MKVAYVQTEKEFSQAIVDIARLLGWRVYRTHDSRRSPAGFPDLVLVRDGRLVFAELKTERGRVTADQQEWLAALGEVEQSVDGWTEKFVRVYVWRPSDWPEIESVLKGER